ncbi:hypothetical protein UFOVP247_208 [uncultured Caudovirales phage]|uniref:Uncharacterized protein n=1 Tax=uncultured Caudovirales phage TaxID=2100421 RepID=A0A6J7WZX0_9CAUD|nr:hypothetical protein UFOVP247_208 [uncultured Caudovirales phage]
MEELIDEVLAKVTTGRPHSTLRKIVDVCSTLVNPRVLMMGVGQGAEAIVVNKLVKNAKVTVVDDWRFSFLVTGTPGLNRYTVENTRSNYDLNLKTFNIDNIESIEGNLFTKSVFKLIDREWDFIYYDISNGEHANDRDFFLSNIRRLWDKMSDNGILMGGSSYYFIDIYRKLTPIVDEFADEVDRIVEFDITSQNQYWIIRKKDILGGYHER